MPTQTESNFDGPMAVEQVRYGDDVLVVSLIGELDAAVVQIARDALEPAVWDPCAMLVIDLSKLEFIDTSGIALLYEIARTQHDKDSVRLLRSDHAGVNRVLELTGVAEVMSVVAG